ncbi:methyl-accepting chemotaxis protein [Paenibacillus sp. J31TS4]|uniref:methyl-accepting chemotaxis protein n=1 Tax=Paenibacillus sp. J31TS4 TaxID=2807195 RepID=UPI001B1F50B9|nr:methyl-accepting chemotaxis protein [Paenibacillus sp. J31TS4]GIP39263.1 methyl-accepting chemotaxis protein [Paenibacillus sp. J31TS4]
MKDPKFSFSRIGEQLKPLRAGLGRTKELSADLLGNPLKSVGMKLFLLFFFSIVLLVVVLGLFSYSTSKGTIEKKVSEAYEQTVTQATDKLDLVFGNYVELTTQLFADSDFMKNIVDVNRDNPLFSSRYELIKKINDRLNMTVNANNTLIGIYLVPIKEASALGTGTINDIAAKPLKEAPWFEETVKAGGTPIWLPAAKKGYVAGEGAFGVARVLSQDYVLLFEIKASVLDDQLESMESGSNSSIVLIDKKGTISKGMNREMLEQKFEIPILDGILGHDKEEGSASQRSSYSGEKLVVYDKMKTSGWSLVLMAPVEELIKDASKIKWLTIIMVLVAMAVAILIGIFVVRSIGRPLIQLRNLMREGEAGNLTVRTKHRSMDEIGELSASFNAMMEQITRLVDHTNRSAAEVLETAGVLLRSSKQTATSAGEIAVATEEIANGASSLASEAEKGNELTHEIGSQMKMVVEANMQMGNAASEVYLSSEKGTQYMAELMTKTNQTETMTRSMVEKVDKLKESTGSIRKILELLTNITRQTNILSLNATIEAARAGAAGKGFMVVADEIRKLADQSKESIEIVGKITETIQSEIDETVNVLSEAYPMFQEQIGSVKEAETIFGSVQKQMGGFVMQLEGVTASIRALEETQQVLNEAMTNVSAVSEESSATSEEVASLSNEQLKVSDELVRLSEKLESLSNSLKDSLAKFTI